MFCHKEWETAADSLLNLSHITVSLQNGQLRNAESARVSMAGQLKNVQSGKTAAAELEHYKACEPASDSVEVTDDNAIQEDEEATFKLPVSLTDLADSFIQKSDQSRLPLEGSRP